MPTTLNQTTLHRATLNRTTLHEMPPLHVTTVGIPPDEHITPRESHRRERALWWGSDRIAWLAAWLLLVLLGFFLVAAALPPRVTAPTAGIAWSSYRGDERAAAYASELSPSLVSPFTAQRYAGVPGF